jgi:hypothetical protein
MTTSLKLRKGFSYDEAILMTQLSKYSYDVFQYDDGSVDDVELKTVYKALYKNQGWELIHCIRNDDSNIRGLLLKNTESEIAHQYAIAFRGSSGIDDGSVNLDNVVSDVDWKLVDYGALANQQAKVVRGFQNAFESVADEIQFFFKTLRGELKPSDFRRIQKLEPLRKFACITAIADAGGVILGEEFQKKAQELIQQIFNDGEVDDDEELQAVVSFLEEELLPQLSPLNDDIEVWVTGHSLGGSLCQLAGLALRRWFGKASSGGLLIKVYAVAACKIGNQDFVDFYNKQVGEELTYRIENTFDAIPTIPLDPPFPISSIAPEGFKVGNVYIGKFANGGEAITVTGIGGQSGSISFGGLFSIPFSVPFPHSPETYIKLLTDQKEFWNQLARPVKDIARPFINDIRDDDDKKEPKSDKGVTIVK